MNALNNTLLWLINAEAVPEATLAVLAEWLSHTERARCERFGRQERRRQFIVGRSLLRLAVHRLIPVAPRDITLRERTGNAPELVFPTSTQIAFSISHSGAWVACAVSVESAVGLDIERVDATRDVLRLAAQAFAGRDLAHLYSLGVERRTEEFYRMWCSHEAQIKLGADAANEYLFASPGLCLALRSARSLAVPPQLSFVTLDTLNIENPHLNDADFLFSESALHLRARRS
jgi:4'-phosphopantetheinyl transferase